MGKKIVYIASYKNRRKEQDVGVINKINGHIKQFRKAGFDVTLLSPKTKNVKKLNKLLIACNLFDSMYKWNQINIDKYTYAVYIRYIRIDWPFICFLKYIKQINSNIKILIEFPTYPYKNLINAHKSEYIKDIIFNKFLKDYVDNVILVTNDYSQIFGIKVKSLANGVDYSDISVKSVVSCDNSINLIAVATMKPWHGYDRLIEGLNIYYRTKNKRKIYLHLVGKGSEIPYYKKLVEQYDLKDVVRFHGNMYGKKLNALYDECDIGIGALAMHHISPTLISGSLKIKEYAAKGLPFVISGACDMENEFTKSYILHVSQNDKPVKIDEIANFYDSIYKKDTDVNSKIRIAFQNYCDINVLFDLFLKQVELQA